MFCSSTKPKPIKVDLNALDNISIDLSGINLVFNKNEGLFKINKSSLPSKQQIKSSQTNSESISKLKLSLEERKLRIKEKTERTKDLESKIKRLDKEIENLKDIIKLDLMDKSYLESLKDQINDENLVEDVDVHLDMSKKKEEEKSEFNLKSITKQVTFN